MVQSDVYVLLNRRKHEAERGGRPADDLDVYSSAAWFEGWRREPREALRLRAKRAPPVAAPTFWLLTQGWKKLGPLAMNP